MDTVHFIVHNVSCNGYNTEILRKHQLQYTKLNYHPSSPTGLRMDARFCLFLADLVRGNCSVKWNVIILVTFICSVDGV